MEWWCKLDSGGTGQWPVVESCEYENIPSGSKKNGEFLEYLRAYWVLQKKWLSWHYTWRWEEDWTLNVSCTT